MNEPICVVVLAAGEGTRMKSARPKPLHHICGRPMVVHVLDATSSFDHLAATVVVVGHGAAWVEKSLTERAAESTTLRFVEQHEQLGTGHAVSVALPMVNEVFGSDEGHVVIVPGDTPLLRAATIQSLIESHVASQAALTVLTAVVDDASGYGRIVYGKDDRIARIVEERDATDEERRITEINTSIMVVRKSLLGPGLRLVGRQNAQNEYYLTDLISVLYDGGHITRSYRLADPREAAGVNDRAQLAAAENELRRRINDRWMRRGVTMWDPATTYVDADVVLSPDVSLLPGTILKGHCTIGEGAQIGPHAYLVDSHVGSGATLGSVVVTGATIGADARVESFSVLGPGTVVSPSEHLAPHTVRSL
ncbi:MAG: NTP transferase domain-containing protein [Acidobacteria bacterium]|nr:NTP transferase domain-containing protein [Acidobacteriota bacterium]